MARFTAENLAVAEQTIARYPRKRSATIPSVPFGAGTRRLSHR